MGTDGRKADAISSFTVGDGIRVLCERMESVRSAVVGVWVGAGSRYERPERLGISHFIEHMLFKGTRRRTARAIAEEIDYVGGHINAFTSKDCTCFYTKTLDSHVGLGADILSDIILHSKLAKKDVDLERNVVLEEINMYEDSPDELVHDLLAETVWKGGPLGYPILGRPETLARIDSGAIRAYMAGKYVPRNVVISVAGCYDEKELRGALEKGFKNLGGAKKGGASAGFDSASGDINSAVEYSAGSCVRQKDTEQVHLCVGFDGIELGDDTVYALQLVNCIFGGGMSSVLFQKIREELGLVYSIYSYITAYRRAGLFTIYAGMQSEQAARVYQMIADELWKFARSGMTEDLLKRAKEQFKGGYVMGLESPNARMSALGKSELLLGYVNTPDEIVAKIDAVTLDDAYGAMQKVFVPEKLALAAVGRIDSRLEKELG